MAADQNIPVDTAISLMRGLEKKWKAIQYIAIAPKPSPYLFERSVTIEINTNRYKVYDKIISEWIQGNAPYISTLDHFSFDGKLFYEWSQSQHGLKLPTENAASTGMITGNLSDAPKNRSFEAFKDGVGLGLPLMFFDVEAQGYRQDNCPGALYEPALMSRYIEVWNKHGNIDSIRDSGNGVLIITRLLPNKNKPINRLVIEYDLNKGGYVTNAKYYWNVPQKNGEFLANEYIIETAKNSQQEWIPVVLNRVNYQSGEGRCFTYKDCYYLDNVTSDMFQIKFPQGTQVTDMVMKMQYKVGDLIDENKAIDEFIRRHGLTGDIPAKIHRGYKLRYVLIGTGLLLIGIAVYQMIQKRRKE